MSKARELSQRAGVDGALSNRNLLINNDFRIWQRGTIFYGGASNWSYTADRWQAGYTATTEKITGGLKMTIGSNTVGNQLFQIVENIDDAFQRNFDTYTATIKFKAPVGVTVALYVKNWGNGWADLFSGSVAATGNEQTLTVSGSSSGLVSGGNPYFNLIFNGATTGQVIEVYDTQLEGGDTATPFEHRSYGQELALCQRYYQHFADENQIGHYHVGFVFNSNQVSTNTFTFPEMRSSPSVVFYKPHHISVAGNWGIYGAINGWSSTGYQPISTPISNNSMTVQFVGVSGVTNGTSYIVNGGFTLDAEL